jgi:hypothetical protein
LSKNSIEVAAQVCAEYSPQTCVDGLIKELGNMDKADQCGAQGPNALLLPKRSLRW